MLRSPGQFAVAAWALLAGETTVTRVTARQAHSARGRMRLKKGCFIMVPPIRSMVPRLRDRYAISSTLMDRAAGVFARQEGVHLLIPPPDRLGEKGPVCVFAQVTIPYSPHLKPGSPVAAWCMETHKRTFIGVGDATTHFQRKRSFSRQVEYNTLLYKMQIVTIQEGHEKAGTTRGPERK